MNAGSRIQRARKIGLFTGTTFMLSWLTVVLFIALGGEWWTPSGLIVGTVFMFMPMVSTIIVQKIIYKEPLRKPLGISFKLNKWWLVAWLLPPLIAFATIGVSLLIPGISYSPEMTGFFERLRGRIPVEQLELLRAQAAASPIHIFWVALIQGLFAGVTVNAVAGLGEELGWRGFLLRELSHMGFWRSSVFIGLIWGVWHAPVILQGHNYPQHPVEGVFMMIIFCLLLSPLFSYTRIKSGSVIAAAIMHGTLNATGGLSIMVVEGGDDLVTGVTGVAGFIVLLVVNFLIFILDNSIRKKPVKDIMEES
ncbi:MAG: CPBP family intramembrane metalloprotease [Thaumarchaeota archaeon]|jgi:membrane protease YdiL (CAAX protease family)|nr:CPBP family intramembrane metalloprotease [Candidatus Geocrenenecus arthurdayi]